MRRFVAFAVSVVLLFSFTILSVYADGGQGWYCVRNKEHKQPIAPSELQYVEKYNGYYIDHKYGDDNEEKVIYLTFDAGYENGNVEKILDVMKQKDVHGAFFILGNLITKNTELVLRMANEGHLVCNHTDTHIDMTKKADKDSFRQELETLENKYRKYVGKDMSKYFRPPEGRFNEQMMKSADLLGYKTIFWSFAYADWDNNSQMSAESAKQKILDNIHNGAVILLHPTSKTNAQILGEVIDELRAQGYRFGTLDELTENGKAG